MRRLALSRALVMTAGVAVAAAAVPRPALADNVNPNNDGSQFAYGENVGWLNAQPQGPGGPGMLVGDFSVTGWMWSENLGWVSLSCANTATCGAIGYGVANDGFGHLSGLAWSENAGWINFSPASGGVAIDAATGNFIGSVWGENVGWISFSAAGPVAYKIQTSWCQRTAAPPAGVPSLAIASSGAGTQLAWSALAGAGWYDVVSGDLGALLSSGGNFTTSTQSCVSNNLVATSAATTVTPAVGKGLWFLVRGEDCKGNGTYDEGGAQVGTRDTEIDASGLTCP